MEKIFKCLLFPIVLVALDYFKNPIDRLYFRKPLRPLVGMRNTIIDILFHKPFYHPSDFSDLWILRLYHREMKAAVYDGMKSAKKYYFHDEDSWFEKNDDYYFYKIEDFPVIKEEFCNSEVVAIDECQFFGSLKDFVGMCLFLKKKVVLAGLDGDYKQHKFGEIIDCIPMADQVTKLSALCMKCKDGTPGPFTKRLVDTKELELVGGNESYEAVCRHHLLS